MAGVTTRISRAAQRPFTSTRLKRVCATTPFRGSESVFRIWFCCPAGNTSITRSIVFAARSVQGYEYKVSCRCGFKRQLDCFEVTHFADEDDIGILAQCTAQRGRERLRMPSYFAMVDQAFLALMNEFDRILDRDDVVFARLIDLIDDRCECRGFAASGRSGDEHKPFVQARELSEDGRKTKLLRCEHF